MNHQLFGWFPGGIFFAQPEPFDAVILDVMHVSVANDALNL